MPYPVPRHSHMRLATVGAAEAGSWVDPHTSCLKTSCYPLHGQLVATVCTTQKLIPRRWFNAHARCACPAMAAYPPTDGSVNVGGANKPPSKPKDRGPGCNLRIESGLLFQPPHTSSLAGLWPLRKTSPCSGASQLLQTTSRLPFWDEQLLHQTTAC